jgi:hypothetical protein
MIVLCGACGIQYDDTYRLTYCPHEYFEMHCHVSVDGKDHVVHSLEELDRLMYHGKGK